MSAHTPGPWVPVLSSKRSDLACVVTEKNEAGFAALVCHIQTAHVETANANARLIASAPELLEALKKLEQKFGDRGDGWPDNRWDAARAAIAKATGATA